MRGDLMIMALRGDLGKLHSALVIQSDLLDTHPSVTILLVTGKLRDTPLFRISVNPSKLKALNKPLQVMVDKPKSIARKKIGAVSVTWMIRRYWQ